LNKNLAKYLSILFLLGTGVVLIGLQTKPAGWFVYALGLLSLLLNEKQTARNLLLIYVAFAFLGITPITTDISWGHILQMGIALVLAAAVPFYISRKVYKDNSLIRYTWHHGRHWLRSEFGYIAATAIVSYFLLPFYLANTAAYLNWSVEAGVSNIGRLFIGTNALGIWDELFFVTTVLGVLRRHLPFWQANFAQALLFTSFLYELGFTGWGPVMIFIFALSQGYIFKKTESLLYVITIHLTLELILFLALIHAYHPSWLPIFVT
jgi:membrane protease YdiL (CAAX protease family)